MEIKTIEFCVVLCLVYLSYYITYKRGFEKKYITVIYLATSVFLGINGIYEIATEITEKTFYHFTFSLLSLIAAFYFYRIVPRNLKDISQQKGNILLGILCLLAALLFIHADLQGSYPIGPLGLSFVLFYRVCKPS